MEEEGHVMHYIQPLVTSNQLGRSHLNSDGFEDMQEDFKLISDPIVISTPKFQIVNDFILS